MKDFRRQRQCLDYRKSRIQRGQIFESLTLKCQKRRTKCQKMYGGKTETINDLRKYKQTDGNREIKTRRI